MECGSWGGKLDMQNACCATRPGRKWQLFRVRKSARFHSLHVVYWILYLNQCMGCMGWDALNGFGVTSQGWSFGRKKENKRTNMDKHTFTESRILSLCVPKIPRKNFETWQIVLYLFHYVCWTQPLGDWEQSPKLHTIMVLPDWLAKVLGLRKICEEKRDIWFAKISRRKLE